MPTIKITPVAKDGETLLAYEPTFEINSHFVPRVGEILHLDRKIDGFYELFVIDVTYELSNHSLAPHITAKVWHQGDRLAELAERGWLEA